MPKSELRILNRLKSKRTPRFGSRRWPAAVLREQPGCDAHKLIVAGCKSIFGYTNIIFHAGAYSVSSALQVPLHYPGLLAADARRPSNSRRE